jgi:hypothetical protein
VDVELLQTFLDEPEGRNRIALALTNGCGRRPPQNLLKLIGNVPNVASKEVRVVAAAIYPGVLTHSFRGNILRVGPMGSSFSGATEVSGDKKRRPEAVRELASNPVNGLAPGRVEGRGVCEIRN